MGTGIKDWLLRRERHRRGLPALAVTREEAVARAAEAWGASPENGTFMDKARVEERPEGWIVWMTSGLKPNRYVRIDGQTGDPSGIWLEPRDPSIHF